jgi:hypothetical protein
MRPSGKIRKLQLVRNAGFRLMKIRLHLHAPYDAIITTSPFAGTVGEPIEEHFLLIHSGVVFRYPGSCDGSSHSRAFPLCFIQSVRISYRSGPTMERTTTHTWLLGRGRLRNKSNNKQWQEDQHEAIWLTSISSANLQCGYHWLKIAIFLSLTSSHYDDYNSNNDQIGSRRIHSIRFMQFDNLETVRMLNLVLLWWILNLGSSLSLHLWFHLVRFRPSNSHKESLEL